MFSRLRPLIIGTIVLVGTQSHGQEVSAWRSWLRGGEVKRPTLGQRSIAEFIDGNGSFQEDGSFVYSYGVKHGLHAALADSRTRENFIAMKEMNARPDGSLVEINYQVPTDFNHSDVWLHDYRASSQPLTQLTRARSSNDGAINRDVFDVKQMGSKTLRIMVGHSGPEGMIKIIRPDASSGSNLIEVQPKASTHLFQIQKEQLAVRGEIVEAKLQGLDVTITFYDAEKNAFTSVTVKISADGNVDYRSLKAVELSSAELKAMRLGASIKVIPARTAVPAGESAPAGMDVESAETAR